MPERKIVVEMVFFVRNVRPLLEALGWTARYGATDAPHGHIVIHGISDAVNPLYEGWEPLREKFTRILDALAAPLDHAKGELLWHYTGDEAIASASRQESAATPAPDPGSRPLPPLPVPIFDYTTLREDPENDRRIRTYSEHMILVDSRYMVEAVKPDFAARGWIYGGNHYGDGSVGLQGVLTADDKVVAPATVLDALRGLKVPFAIHHQSPKPADRVEEYDYEAEEQGEDGMPTSLDEAEAEGQEAMEAAMEAEEEELEPAPTVTSLEDVPGSQLDATGALRLEEGEEMHIAAVYVHATEGAEIRLEIGYNVITVVSSYKQATQFLAEAGRLDAQIMRDRERNLEEAESDGGKESERDEFTEQGPGSQ